MIVLAREASCSVCEMLGALVPLVNPMPVVAPVVLSVIVRLLVVPVAVAVILPPDSAKVTPGTAAVSAVSTPPTVGVVVRSMFVPVVAAPVLVKVIVTGAPAPTCTTSVSPAEAMLVDASPVSAAAPAALADVSLAMVVKSCGFSSSLPEVFDSWYCPFLGSCGRLSW